MNSIYDTNKDETASFFSTCVSNDVGGRHCFFEKNTQPVTLFLSFDPKRVLHFMKE
jgi:hypothetical protein